MSLWERVQPRGYDDEGPNKHREWFHFNLRLKQVIEMLVSYSLCTRHKWSWCRLEEFCSLSTEGKTQSTPKT